MTESEANDAIRRLSAALADRGFDWLVAEVAGAVEEGRGQEKITVKRPRRTQVRTIEEQAEGRQGAGFTRTVRYTAQEHLDLLTSAVGNVLADSAAMNEILVQEFGSLAFVSERVTADQLQFSIDARSIAVHNEAKDRALALIKKIRKAE